MKPIVLVTGDLLPEQPAGLAPTDLLFTTPLPISNVCVFSIRFEISLRSACVDITASILTNKHPLITKFALNRVIRPGFVVLHGGFINVIVTAENPYVEIPRSQFGLIGICLPKNKRQINYPIIHLSSIYARKPVCP